MSTASGLVVIGATDWINGEEGDAWGGASSETAWVDFEPTSGSVDMQYEMLHPNHNMVSPMKFEEMPFPVEISFDWIMDVSSYVGSTYVSLVVGAIREELWVNQFVYGGYDGIQEFGFMIDPIDDPARPLMYYVSTGHIPIAAPGYSYDADVVIPGNPLNRWFTVKVLLDDYGVYAKMWPRDGDEPEGWPVWERSDWTMAECNSHLTRWIDGVEVPVPLAWCYPTVPFNAVGFWEIDTKYYYSPTNMGDAQGYFRFENFDTGAGAGAVSGSGR